MEERNEPALKDLLSIILKQEENMNKRLESMSGKMDSINNRLIENLNAVEAKITTFDKSLEFLSIQYDSQRKMINNAINKQSHLETENAQLREEIQKLEKNIKVNQQSLNDIEQYGRRECVEIAGVPVMEKENTEQVAINLFKKINVDVQPNEI